MLKVSGTTIAVTKGDTVRVFVIPTVNGEPYEIDASDEFRFACKKSNGDVTCAIRKPLIFDSEGNLMLELTANETEKLDVGTYVYDIQLTRGSDGSVDTFIDQAKLRIMAEVD